MNDLIPAKIAEALSHLQLPKDDSHKGQNGKLLIIGGSELFHAASKWSLDIASKFVDMVFYSSVPANNELVKAVKTAFWNGIVVPREELENYLVEADCVLIGPGMTRTDDTEKLVNSLLKKHPLKKWVIDAGALQMVDPSLLNEHHIITPHHQELKLLLSHTSAANNQTPHSFTQIVKGPQDEITHGQQTITIEGGNPGMTKGGTGDVLAGLVAAFYCQHDAWTAAIAGSYFNKKAGELLYQTVGPFFNSSDLVEAVPKVVWQYFELR